MRHLLLLIIFISISGCTSQFAYRHLDWIILWYSNDYLDLSRTQEKQLSLVINDTLLWHRKSELPKYRNHLIDISNDLHALPLSMDKIQLHGQRTYEYWVHTRAFLNNKIVSLVYHLSSDQIDYLFNKLEKKNIKRLEYLSETPLKERQEDRIDRWLDALEDILGEITPKQEELIKLHINNQNDLTELRVQYLQTFQAQLKQALINHIDEETLLGLLNHPEVFKSDDYRNQQLTHRNDTFQLIYNLSIHLTPDQIFHLQQIINDYIAFIDELIPPNN